MSTALLIVDAQLDFTEGGALGIDGATDAFRRTAEMLREGRQDGSLVQDYDIIVTTQDWHVDPGDHWSEAPDYRETWPEHCRAGTPGAELNPLIETALRGMPSSFRHRVTKGEHDAANSAFEGTDQTGAALDTLLRSRAVDAVHLAGVATEQCVRGTALDALGHGYQVHLLTDQIAAGDPTRGQAALVDMRQRGVRIPDSRGTWHPS